MTRKTKGFALKSIIILLVAVLIGTSCYIYYQKEDATTESLKSTRRDQLSVLSGMIYRHLIGYNFVCKEAGSPLKKYPDYFSKKYQDDIIVVDKSWHRYGKTLEDVLIKFDSSIYPTISEDIKKELIDLERVVATHLLARQNNVPVNQIQWNDELEKQMKLSDACILLDDGASFLLDNSSFDKEFKARVDALKKM